MRPTNYLSLALLGLAIAVAVSRAVPVLRKRVEARARDERLDHTLEDSFPASDPPPF